MVIERAGGVPHLLSAAHVTHCRNFAICIRARLSRRASGSASVAWRFCLAT